MIKRVNTSGCLPMEDFKKNLLVYGYLTTTDKDCLKRTIKINKGFYVNLRIPIPFVDRINNPFALGTTEYACNLHLQIGHTYRHGLQVRAIKFPIGELTPDGFNPQMAEPKYSRLEDDGIFFVGEREDMKKNGFSEDEIARTHEARSSLKKLLDKEYEKTKAI